ncbi:MAG: sugar ABC transporter ATP-binding protein, partial [Bacillota bacterium]|nr:sugar ABC transporter ATP-binding protein [Bacillota bacterium]
KALKSVNFTAEGGKVHAVVGANGAGKSTLMKILSGAYNHYTGQIFIDKKPMHITSPKAAKEKGIQVVYQEVDTVIVPYLSAAENILLDEIANGMDKEFFINWKSIYKKAEEILKGLNLNISVRKLGEELTLAEKQMVLIARAISSQCKFLILDEPTAPLSNRETEELFKVIKDLKSKNVGIIFISHRLPELFEICDEVTILRDGELVINKEIKALTQNKIVEYMLGKSFKQSFEKRAFVSKENILRIENLRDNDKLKGISLYANKGEILGVAGLVGAGKTELCNAVFGASNKINGDIFIKGKSTKIKSPRDAVKNKIALIPEERRKEGILTEESIAVNISSTDINKFSKTLGFFNLKKESEVALDLIRKLQIKAASENQKAALLSGGNQQKVVVGKWLHTDAEIFIFDEPTKGVDIGAREDIFKLIRDLADQGRTIIYASCEMSELLGITDRIYAIYDGKIVKELRTNETNEEELLFYSTGGH